MIKEITAQELDPESFIDEKVEEIRHAVGDGLGHQCSLRRRRFVYGHAAWDIALWASA